MSLLEVYYEHYANGKGDDGRRVLPYMVNCLNDGEAKRLFDLLKSSGYQCVAWNVGFHVLVNTEFRRFGMIHYPCKHSCVDDRIYTLEEFLRMFLQPAYSVIRFDTNEEYKEILSHLISRGYRNIQGLSLEKYIANGEPKVICAANGVFYRPNVIGLAALFGPGINYGKRACSFEEWKAHEGEGHTK